MNNLDRGSNERRVSVTYDPETGVYRGSFDGASILPSLAVAKVIGQIHDPPAKAFEPLHSAVDPDALDMLCTKQHRDGDRSVSFTYLDYSVTVKSYGVITVRPLGANAARQTTENDF